MHSISRCALLNAPAGSFSSRNIVKIELNRVVVTRVLALVRFGEEKCR
jgi:hypothetical protein